MPFQYQPFDGSRYAASIADALAQMAAPDARAADMRGQVAGQTARQIAQTIGAIPQQIQAGKDAAQERELRQQQLTAGAGELKDKEAARATATQRRVATSVGWAASKATSPEDFAARVDGLAAGGAIPMDTAAHIKQAAGSDAWDAVKQRYVDFASQFMEPVKLGEGDQLIDPLTHQAVVSNPKPKPQPTEAALAATANDPAKTPAERAAAQAAIDSLQAPAMAGRDETARHNAELERIANLTSGREEARSAEIARHNRATEAAAAATRNDITDLTPAGLDMAALNYRKTGVMPALGNGDKVTRRKIIDRAAALTAEDAQRIEAGGLDVAGNRAEYRADADTLKTLVGQRTAIGAFEQTAQKNIDLFLKQAEKIADTGSPLLNLPVRMVTGKLLGAPDQAAYDAARQVAVNEIAKITSNPTLAGQLSDSARHEVEAFNPGNATLKQSIAVMRLLKQDMQNRTTSLDAAIADTRKRIGGGPAPAAPTGPKEGDTQAIPNMPGAEATFKGGKWVRTK